MVYLSAVCLACVLQVSVTLPVDTKKVPGCYLRDARYLLTHLDHVTNPIQNVFDFFECQMLCSKTTGCGRFVYSASSLFCYLGAEDQGVVDEKGAVSGPAVCPEDPAPCSQLPIAPFPAETPEQSQRAWPMNYTPTLLQCWPWNANVQPAFCKSHPPVALETAAHVGQCKGMRRVDLPEAESCGRNCAGNVLCSSWQERQDEDAQAPDGVSCYQGLGEDCMSAGPKVVDAGRLQHGQYRVLADLKYVQLMGLSFAFHDGAELQQVLQRCRNLCLSLLLCQAWQYSTDAGCYIENPFIQAMPYPPVVLKNSNFAHAAVAGEYLQRLCPGYLSRTRWDAQDTILVAYDAKEAAPQKIMDAPEPTVLATTTQPEESTRQTSKPAKPAASLTPSDTMGPTIPPASRASTPAAATPSSSSITTAVVTEGIAATPTAETASSTATLMPTLTLEPPPLPTVANVATPSLPTLAPLATLAPPTVVAPSISGELVPGVAKHKGKETSEEAILMGQGGHGKSSLSDGLSIGLGVFGVVMVCVGAHCLRVHQRSNRWTEDEEESFLQ